MDTNPDEIVQQIRSTFDTILAYVARTDESVPSAYQVERHLLTTLLSLGRGLMLVFFLTQQSRIRDISTVCVNGQELPLHCKKKRSLRSIFGKVAFERGYYYREGCGSYFLLDARLQLPEHSLSDLLREWLSRVACYVPYHKSRGLLKDIIAQEVATRAIEKTVLDDSSLVQTFYEQAPPPARETEAAILVVQADGKGIPMLPETPQPVRVRLGKGEKAGRKKEAIVTSVYTIAARVRTAEDVVDNLFKQTQAPVSASKPDRETHTGPQNKWLWATLEGKSTAIEFTAAQVALRESEHITMHVALTDGSAALQEKVRQALPQFSLVLDIIHAVEYLWEAGNSLHGEKSDRREPWVKERVLLLLRGQTEAVISNLRALAAIPSRKKTAKAVLEKVADYYERNSPYMRYDAYLAHGWPIATGVIEGACRHLVKDRCELSGMHWRVPGAEALLRLRCVAENQDWDDFHTFRRKCRQQDTYGSSVGEDSTTIEIKAARANTQAAEKRAA